MNHEKIVSNIWFSADEGNISKVIEYYKGIFGKDFQGGQLTTFGGTLGGTPSGHTEMCEIYLFGQKYIFMNTSQEHQLLNDAISFIINCKDQDEIDKYWNYFTKDGEESQCGWCIDKYGLRWQVLPENLEEIMCKPNSFEIMMRQKKIIISEYLKPGRPAAGFNLKQKNRKRFA